MNVQRCIGCRKKIFEKRDGSWDALDASACENRSHKPQCDFKTLASVGQTLDDGRRCCDGLGHSGPHRHANGKQLPNNLVEAHIRGFLGIGFGAWTIDDWMEAGKAKGLTAEEIIGIPGVTEYEVKNRCSGLIKKILAIRRDDEKVED